MTGGLMQLVAYGAQDIYLTGNPMITYFKIVYRRHTNFAMESIRQTFSGVADFGNKVTSLLSRNGDLVSGVYLQSTLPNLTATGDGNDHQRWTDDIGHYLIKEVSIDIGGQIIDKHYGDWLEIWSQLTVPAGQIDGYREMIGQDPRNPLGMETGLQRDMFTGGTITGRTIFVPLQFWFCRNVGLALPLISLQYHEVKINITFSDFTDMVVNHLDDAKTTPVSLTTGILSDTDLWVDYIYLDTDERRRFAQVSHEYLIEQLQYTDHTIAAGTTSANIALYFNHPVKELVWVTRFNNVITEDAGKYNQWSNYTTAPAIKHGLDAATYIYAGLTNLGLVATDQPTATNSAATNINVLANQAFVRPYGGVNPIATAQLKLNGHDRFAVRDGAYFNWVQCRDRHTNVPRSPGINVYSFALKPEDHQPSGTCNFSRIDNAQLVLTFATGLDVNGAAGPDLSASAKTVKIYGVNYNVLRIMSGMGGLAYSN